MKTVLTGMLLAAALAACASIKPSPVAETAPKAAPKVAPKDGELTLPDYTSWPVFLLGVQKLDARQIRDIYINPTGATAVAGGRFPNGTQAVMEIHSLRTQPDGTPMLKDGKLVRDKLVKIYVMAKGENWGASVPEPLKNGDWIYTAFDAAGVRSGSDMSSCRACHLPLTAKDYMPRYDEYFHKRAPG